MKETVVLTVLHSCDECTRYSGSDDHIEFVILGTVEAQMSGTSPFRENYRP